MRFLDDARLYTSTEHCLGFLRTLDELALGDPPRRERYHLFWQGPFGSKQAFAVESLLATHHVSMVEVWLWLDKELGHPGHEASTFLRPLLDRVTVRPFDVAVEARGTPLGRKRHLYDDAPPKARSDFVRHVVLYRYGGIYADLDIMFLRDLRLLDQLVGATAEYCYAWSDRPYGNTAVLRLEAGSATARALLERCAWRDSCHPRIVTPYRDDELDLLVLPSAVVDPLWLTHDGKDSYPAPFVRYPDFFAPATVRSDNLQTFFPGAFAYHWHNCWDADEPPTSYFGSFRAQLGPC